MNALLQHILEPVPNMADIGHLARIFIKCFFLGFGVTV